MSSSTRHIIGHFRDESPRQSLALVLTTALKC